MSSGNGTTATRKEITVSICMKTCALPDSVWIDAAQIQFGAGKIYMLKNGSVDHIHSLYLFQRIPARNRITFMDEVYRCLKKNGKATIIVPHWNHVRAYADPTHEWPPITDLSFMVFNRKWREEQGFHIPMKCDFDVSIAYAPEENLLKESPELRNHMMKYFSNTVSDIHATLKKIGE